jgi:hypothetical protein
MQTRKIIVPLLAILILGIASPALTNTIPKAHADDQAESISITGFLARNYYDTFLGCCEDVIQSGNTLTFNLIFTANSVNYERNLTLGVKFDWMNNYVNSSQVSVFAGQTITVSLQYTMPALTGANANLNQVTHSWTLQAWDLPQGGTWSASSFCWDYNNQFPPFGSSCRSWSSSNYPYHPVGIYNSAQASSYSSKLQAGAIINSLSSILGSTNTPAPGTSSALALLAKANTEYNLGNSAYASGDFSTAQTDYQNAENDANAAQSSLQTVGGGTDTSTLTSIWIDSVAILFGGIGALLVGFAGFKYLRGKTRAITGYTPAASPK